MNLPVLELSQYEADDVIGTIAKKFEGKKIETVIVTGDKDMMQLVDERTWLLDTMRERRFGPAEVQARFGVAPALVPDVLGLMGDAIDNIPGVSGIGEKTAAVLVARLGRVEDILGRLDEIPTIGIRGAKKVADTLREHVERLRVPAALKGALECVAQDA